MKSKWLEMWSKQLLFVKMCYCTAEIARSIADICVLETDFNSREVDEDIMYLLQDVAKAIHGISVMCI